MDFWRKIEHWALGLQFHSENAGVHVALGTGLVTATLPSKEAANCNRVASHTNLGGRRVGGNLCKSRALTGHFFLLHDSLLLPVQLQRVTFN